MLECRVELQKLAGVALRTFLAQEIDRNADDYGRMIWGSKSHQKFRTRRNNMFITRPHFGLCLSFLTAYHYHIRRPSPLLSVCNGYQRRRVCENSPFVSRVPPIRNIRAHLTGFFRTAEQPLIEKETYRLTRRVPTHRRAHTRQFGACHPERNTNAIRVSLL